MMPTIGPVTLTVEDLAFFEMLRQHFRDRRVVGPESADAQAIFDRTHLPKHFWGFALTVYQPGNQRLMVVRAGSVPALENVHRTIARVLAHPRVGEFDFRDRPQCRIQADFIVDEPEPVDLAALSESVLDANRFEIGIDGLRIVGPGRCRYVLPGDAFVWSILSLKQLRKHIGRLFPGTDLGELEYYRFRSASYVSTADGWIRLDRGYPAVTPVTKESLLRAAEAGVHSIVSNQQPDGRFLYYYDAATDSRRDHEHPTRNPETDPYYNLLRHCGGVITTLLYHACCRAGTSPPLGASRQRTASPLDEAALRQAAESAIGFYLQQLVHAALRFLILLRLGIEL